MKTREHEYKLYKRVCRSQLIANVFGMGAVNLWDNLPAAVVEAAGGNCLKGRVDKLSGDQSLF